MSLYAHHLFLAILLGWQDVKDTYQRSTLGPLWITLGLAIQVFTIGLVFGLIFRAELSTYLPFLTISLVIWNFLTSTVNESTNAYLNSSQILKQMYVPAFFPVLRVVAKNVFIFVHNWTIIVGGLIFSQIELGADVLLVFPGLVLVVGVVYSVSTAAAIVSVRYRDIPPIIATGLMVSFYVTPIIWTPETIPQEFREFIVVFNPLYHLMELVRAPLTGEMASAANWLVTLGLLAFLGSVSGWMSRRYSWKIAYWL